MTPDTPVTGTAMQILIDKLTAMINNGGDSDLIPVRHFATELLAKEREQHELSAIWGCNHAIENNGNKDVNSEDAFNKYFTQTYSQL